MKLQKNYYLLVLVLLVIPYLAKAVETKYSMEIWNRLSMIDDGSDADASTSFSVERAYLRIEPKFTDNIKGRFNLDFFSSDKDADANGVGVKLKYAYLDFKNIIPLPKSKLSVGLVKNYFGTIYSWKYETIQKDPSDKWKFASSTDYGVVLSGAVPVAKLNYNLGLYNGEGYKKSGDSVNNEFAFLANVRVKPIDMLEFGGTLSLNSKNNPNNEAGEENEEHQAITTFAGMTKLNVKEFSLLAQYIGKTVEEDNLTDSEDVSSNVISIMPMYNIKSLTNINLELVGRYDIYDPNSDNDDDGKTLALLGANYHFAKGLQLQANYQIISHEDDDEDDISEFMLQLRWKFSSVMSN
ncbi:MAG: hypothetical protein B6226_05820 [Candidatus Cloacimonetes bacterium 4572_65]|nr:MAG: hypothetical protein B6226_05820 [Candidatus Cloacimonetes bacterium 4572_65]